MSLRFSPDTAAADWLVRSGTPDLQLITFGPAGFGSYGRLRFIPDPHWPGMKESDAEVPDDHPTDIEQARRALRVLAGFTSTPEDCYFGLWEGFSDALLPPEVQRGPLIELPHRRYALLRGGLPDLDGWEAELGAGQPIAPPAFVWPADHRWVFTCDVDPHWAGIGAEPAAVDALVRDPRLDVVPADPAELPPEYR